MEYNEGLGSIRTKKAPKKTGIGYKVFYQKDGKLYPPMVANPGGVDTPIGVWLDADAAPIVGNSKTGRPQVKNGGKGTQGGSGTLAYRPGWHLGLIPYAIQFNRKDENGEKTLFPKDFVWAEVEYAADKNYQKEAEAEGYTENGKYRHSYAGLKHLPTDGYYIYRTNPNPETDPWIITGAMKVNRILSKKEVDELVRKAGREPQRVEEEGFTDGLGSIFGVSGIDEDFADKLNYFIENGYSLGNRYDYFSCGYANDILQACGLKSDIEIVITQSGMKKILGEKVGKKDNAHDLTPIEVLRLPQLIQKPILVINGNTSDTRLIFVEIPRRGRKMFAVVDLDINLFLGKQGKYNLIASVYSQENYKVVEKIVSASLLNNIHYYDSTKIKSWLSEAGQLQLLPTITTNSMFSEIDFPNDANIQRKLFYPKENDKGIGKVSKKKETTMEQFQNRRQARASQLKKGDNITYTEDDFFRVECDDLKRVHEAIMYWNEKLPKKSIAWLDDLLLDDKGYPIYTVLEQAELFIESYNLYKDEWKKNFIFGDSSSDNEVRLWVMNNRIGRADENLYKEITKVHHKPSLLLIYEWIKKSIIRRDDDAEYEKMGNSYLEKIKKHIDSLKDDELIDKMVNAHKRAFSDNVTLPKQITLAECYKYCSTDNNKLAYTGIYHDPKGFAVVTNGQILYAHNNLYESKSKGNIIDKSGKVIDSKFPDWQAVVNRYANNTKILTPIDIDRDDFYRKLCMYERKFKYRRHHIPVQPFSIRYGDNEYLWPAELLKGLVLMSYAHKDVKFYLSVIKHEGFSGDDVFLVAKSSDGSVGILGDRVGGFDGWYLDETNKYGLIQDTFTKGEPFLLDSVYQYAQGKQDGKKSNNLQLAKAKMKMAAARIKLMKM